MNPEHTEHTEHRLMEACSVHSDVQRSKKGTDPSGIGSVRSYVQVPIALNPERTEHTELDSDPRDHRLLGMITVSTTKNNTGVQRERDPCPLCLTNLELV